MRVTPLDIPREASVDLPASEQLVVSRRVSREQARRLGAAAITGVSEGAAFDAVPMPELFQLPIYRVEVVVEGVDVRLGNLHYVRGRIVPSPAIATGRREHVHLTLARRRFPHRLITFSSLSLHRSTLELRGGHELKGTVLEPDVSRKEAEEAAVEAVLRLDNPSAFSLYSKREPRTSSLYCLYPIYVFRYVVDDLEYHLTICGHTGAIVSQHAPSRALLTKGPIAYFDPESGESTEGPGPTSRDPRAAAPAGAHAYALRTRITIDDARERSKKAILSSILRPSDIATARIREPVLFQMPFWRVDVSVDSFHVSVGTSSVSDPTIYPGGGSRGRGVIERARRTSPEQTRGKDREIGDAAVVAMTVRTLGIDPSWLERRDDVPLTGEVIEADVGYDQAVQESLARIVSEVRPSNALFSRVEPKVHAAWLCHVPLWVTLYEYSGEVVLSEKRFFVILSGANGAVVHEHHPSAPRALAAKLRKILSFDRR
jgi:hypothetical protein